MFGKMARCMVVKNGIYNETGRKSVSPKLVITSETQFPPDINTSIQIMAVSKITLCITFIVPHFISVQSVKFIFYILPSKFPQ